MRGQTDTNCYLPTPEEIEAAKRRLREAALADKRTAAPPKPCQREPRAIGRERRELGAE
jgi:hypothetical protein